MDIKTRKRQTKINFSILDNFTNLFNFESSAKSTVLL